MKTLVISMTDQLLQIILVIDAKKATINFEKQRIKSIFVVNFATNESFHISKG